MAEGALSIKLRCASWQQLATIYKRDLSHGAMFLKASTPPAIGTPVHIDLTLPSATVIALSGVVHSQIEDPQRGAGIELKLAPIPTGTIWLIESALASEHKRLATPAHGTPIRGPHQMTSMIPTITDAADVAAAERDLVKALVSEAESLKKLNPFLVLGVGYEASDGDVRAAFGELTKRYHPDRFARYESAELRQVAAEIFILIRDAYRRLGDTNSRVQLLASLGKPAPAPRAVPAPPRVTQAVPPPRMTQRVPALGATPTSGVPTVATAGSTGPTAAPGSPAPGSAPTAILTPPIASPVATGTPPAPSVAIVPSAPRPPTTPPATQVPRSASASAASAPPRQATTPPATKPAQPSAPPGRVAPKRPFEPAAASPSGRSAVNPLPAAPAAEPPDSSALEELIDQGKLDEALAGYKLMAKRYPQDRLVRAGVELCEGLRALTARDRLEAAQRFEAALEIDPSNERAARELAEMRRQATNERKGLLSRLMGKKEP
jgi:hypothetical protein